MIMFGWTFRWFHQKKKLSSDAGFVEYEGFWFAVKLITRSARVFSWPFDWFHGATYSPWLISFLERTSESPWYSKCQPLIFPQGKLLSYSKTLFTMFSVLSVDQHFLSSFTLTRISKVHASWRLKQTRISKTLYKHYMRVASFDFGEIQTQKTTFLEVRSSLFLHHPVIENCLFQCAVKQPIKLMSWTIFCAPKLYKKNSIFCRWNKSTHDFIPHLFVSVFSRFGAHSPVHLWQV